MTTYEIKGKFQYSLSNISLVDWDDVPGLEWVRQRDFELAQNKIFRAGKEELINPVKFVITGPCIEKYNGFITDHGIVTREYYIENL